MGVKAIHAARMLAASLTMAAFLAACTRQELRPPVEVRHFHVDWEHADAAPVEGQGLRARGILLTPTQWPLEGSLKRLFKGDFLGVIDAFDLRFHSSTIPTGVLEELYGRGFVPAYVRMENPSDEARLFTPEDLVVRDKNGGELAAANPDDLPRTFTRVDLERTLLAAATVVLIAAVLVSGREGRLNLGSTGGNLDVRYYAYTEVNVQPRIDAEASGAEAAAGKLGAGPGTDRSLLRAQTLAPGDAREGIILFVHRRTLVDWASARLAWR